MSVVEPLKTWTMIEVIISIVAIIPIMASSTLV